MINKICIFIALSLSLFLAGCVTPSNVNNSEFAKEKIKYMSAGSTGCLPADMNVEFIDPKWNHHGVWTVKCKSQLFVCSAAGVDQNIASCSPSIEQKGENE